MFTCQLFKITVGCLWPNDSRSELTFWGYHFDEAKARDAALLWGAKDVGDAAIVSINKVELIK